MKCALNNRVLTFPVDQKLGAGQMTKIMIFMILGGLHLSDVRMLLMQEDVHL